MKKLGAFILITAVLVSSQLWLNGFYFLIPIWVMSGFLVRKMEVKNVFLWVFLIEAVVMSTFIYLNRDSYIYLENWMSNLEKNSFLFYLVEVLFNGLNAAFCFLLGSAFVKVKKKKIYSGPYHF